MIVGRFASFKMDEAAMAEVAATAAGGGQARIAAAQALEEARMAQAMASRNPSVTSGPDDTLSPKSPDLPLANEEAEEPYRHYLIPGEEIIKDSSGRKTFLGPPAGRSMIRRVSQVHCIR